MKVVRVVVYEGTEDRMQKQLSTSLPDGVKHGFTNITVITVRPEDLDRAVDDVQILRSYIQQALDWTPSPPTKEEPYDT